MNKAVLNWLPPSPQRKIKVAELASWDIPRPRLLKKLTEVLSVPMTVVQAGPGFGKSSLLRSWADHLKKDNHVVAWLSLDRHDDDAATIFPNLARALSQAGLVMKQVQNCARAGVRQPAYAWANAILADLTQENKLLFVILDDFHLISRDDVHSAISHLFKYAPPNVRLILASLTALPTVLESIHTQAPTVEIDAPALAFDIEELRSFLIKEEIDGVGSFELCRLHERTEGWPALVRVITVWAKNAPGGLSGCVDRLTAQAKPIRGFMDGVMARLPQGLAQYMLSISILKRLRADACLVVTQDQASENQIKVLASQRLLFSIGGDEGLTEYRFPLLLREYFQSRLHAEHPRDVAVLHRRAAAWSADHGFWEEAIDHAVAAGDLAQAKQWLGQHASTLVGSGCSSRLLKWPHLLSKASEIGDTKAKLAIAWAMIMGAQLDEARGLVSQIEREDVFGPDAQAVEAQCQLLREYFVAFGEKGSKRAILTEFVRTGSVDSWTNNAAGNMVALSAYRQAEYGQFYDVPWIPLADEHDAMNVQASTFRSNLHSCVAFDQLQLDLAERHATDAFEVARSRLGDYSLAATFSSCSLARVRYEQGRVAEAEELASRNLAMTDSVGMAESVHIAYRALVRCAIARGDRSGAHKIIDRVKRVCVNRGWTNLRFYFLAERFRLLIIEQRSQEAHATRRRLEHALKSIVIGSTGERRAVEASSLLALARTGTTSEKLAHLDAIPISSPYVGLLVELSRASVAWSAGDAAAALVAFRKAALAAAPHRYRQTFNDYCQATPILLDRLVLDSAKMGLSKELLSWCAEMRRAGRRHPRNWFRLFPLGIIG
ncbi:MalT transcriptional regulator family protein [Tardiphaga alba]|uniref:hypothetical protein n=1 Tax=Tardiphaga alba TaxID=340268 RepID=UPI001BA9ED9A|nr:hypothetical protein [Tardiphaga alba]